jgi:hypothetical protein
LSVESFIGCDSTTADIQPEVLAATQRQPNHRSLFLSVCVLLPWRLGGFELNRFAVGKNELPLEC